MPKKAAKKRATASRKGAKRGPKEDRLKLEGDWKDLMRRSLRKKRPPEGWPK
jgi:hypothetical protein